MKVTTKRPRLNAGTRINEYEVVSLIGSGGYGDVYIVRSTSCDLRALKTEFFEAQKKGLAEEEAIYRRIQGSGYFPTIYSSGLFDNFRYLIIELLGPSVSNTRRRLPNHRYSKSGTIRISYEMLLCIEAFHSKGLVHRDIKPGNFLIRGDRKHPLCLIDYGLSASYIDPVSGRHISSDKNYGFVGTHRYCSINAHKSHKLSRRDDLCSWLYSTVELIDGSVPWPGSKDVEETLSQKESLIPEILCRSLPPCYIRIYQYIQSLSFKQEPNYKGIKELLLEALSQNRRSEYDWEKLPPSIMAEISPIEVTMYNDSEPSDILPPHKPLVIRGKKPCEIF